MRALLATAWLIACRSPTAPAASVADASTPAPIAALSVSTRTTRVPPVCDKDGDCPQDYRCVPSCLPNPMAHCSRGSQCRRTRLPAADTRCTRDADCGVLLLELEGPRMCCAGCGTSTAGNTAWVADATKICEAYMKEEQPLCPALACPTGPTSAECKAGSCTLKR